jgi:hypothetical protein
MVRPSLMNKTIFLTLDQSSAHRVLKALRVRTEHRVQLVFKVPKVLKDLLVLKELLVLGTQVRQHRITP